MEYMVCTRFHSMILSMLCKQKIYNLTYNQKHNNVIKDSHLFLFYKKIQNINFETKVRKVYFSKVRNYKLNKLIKNSQKQFENIENVKKEFVNSRQ